MLPHCVKIEELTLMSANVLVNNVLTFIPDTRKQVLRKTVVT